MGPLLLCTVVKWHLKTCLSSDQPKVPATWRRGVSQWALSWSAFELVAFDSANLELQVCRACQSRCGTGEVARANDSWSFPDGKVWHACDLSQLNLGLGCGEGAGGVCGDSEEGEVSSDRHAWVAAWRWWLVSCRQRGSHDSALSGGGMAGT